MKNKNKKIHTKQKTKKVSLSDKAANFLFCEIIDFLIKKYENSNEKETMSFKEYCISLRDLSIQKTKIQERSINDECNE